MRESFGEISPRPSPPLCGGEGDEVAGCSVAGGSVPRWAGWEASLVFMSSFFGGIQKTVETVFLRGGRAITPLKRGVNERACPYISVVLKSQGVIEFEDPEDESEELLV